MKRITRSEDKLVAGVISGISNYVNPVLDPIFFRLAFAFLTIYQPYLILIYLGMAFVLPVEDVSYSK